MNMDEDIVAVPPRRDAHAMEMQIARIVRQIVLECNSHNVARACSQQRRQIGVIVQKSGERDVAQLNHARSSGERRIEDTILTANLRWLNQQIAGLSVDTAGQ